MSPNAALVESAREESPLLCTEYETPELMITHSLEARKTFDDFMWTYAGDPFLSSYPEIRRNHPLVGECEYGNRIMSYCYSQEGSLVHIRRTWEMSNECREADYFVATASLVDGGPPIEWEVLKVIYTNEASGGNMKIDLVLRNGANTSRLHLTNQGFMWFDGKSPEPEVLLPGSELSTKLSLMAAPAA